MTDLFLDILNTSLSATWVVLAVVLARILLKKAPRGLVCGLWSLVGLRLLIGGQLEAPVSLIPSAEVIPPQSLLDTAPAIDSGIPLIDQAVNPVYTESLRPMAGASVNPLQVWMAFFANLWLLGMIAMALWALWSAWRVRRQVGESLCMGGNVFLCDRLESPFIFGLLRPRIYLPSDLDDDAKAHVIAHEEAHIARRDHWWKPLAFALLTVNWFNPAMWLAYILLCRDIEMACDERVVKDLTLSDKKAYSASLLRCSVKARYVTACPLAFGEVGVKERIKSVLNYKKPAFWVIAVTLIVTLVLGVGLLTSPVERVIEIRYNGCLYVLFNSDYSFLPAEDPVGTLCSILHHTGEHPTEEFQGTNLDESLAGCPLYLEGDQLYLLKYDGSCMAFRLLTPHTFLREALRKAPTCLLMTKAAHTEGWEGLHSTQNAALLQLLESLTSTAEFTPFSGPQPPEYVLSMEFYTDDGLTILFRLRQCPDGVWLLDFWDSDLGPKVWLFQSDALTEWAQPYLLRAEAHDTLFAGQTQSITYHTAEINGVSMTLGTPEGWDAETALFDRGTVLRCKPASSEQWMEITYYDHNDTLYYTRFEYESITLANGAAGTLCHSGNPAHWQLLVLDTVQGQLHITSPATEHEWDWTDEDFQSALTILSTLTVTENGTSLLGQPNRMGLTLSVSDVTPHGLTLLCAQDGTSVAEVWTGSQWWVEQLVDGKWVHVFPGDETAWTTEAYPIPIGGTRDFHVSWTNFVPSLNPGTYRIAKSFYANLTPVTILSPDPETVTQIYYAEFTIE
ncbi:MAG: hypothetical protein IKD27_09250 [Oscillospiraceae bacterium]|nr:hypothetical protein [Oscillospiraceae bacterium]